MIVKSKMEIFQLQMTSLDYQYLKVFKIQFHMLACISVHTVYIFLKMYIRYTFLTRQGEFYIGCDKMKCSL